MNTLLLNTAEEIIGAVRKNIYLGLNLQQANLFTNMFQLVSSITKKKQAKILWENF